MLERPNLADTAILRCAQAAFDLPAQAVDFLPWGNDATAWVYRLHAPAAGQPADYFVKIKSGGAAGVKQAALAAPHFLRGLGLGQVVAPLTTRAGDLWAEIEAYTLVVYPYITGQTGMDGGLTPAQWTELGRTLQQMHTAPVPPELAALLRRETFHPPWAGMVRQIDSAVGLTEPAAQTDDLAAALAGLWQRRRAEITHCLARAEALGARLRAQPPALRLCHGDIHTANVLVDGGGGLHIVDWDEASLAPVERDLMFITNDPGLSAAFTSPEVRAFFAGYGPAQVDPTALSYYQYEWVVQELGDFGERVLYAPEAGRETRSAALAGLEDLFRPGDVVETAVRGDRG